MRLPKKDQKAIQEMFAAKKQANLGQRAWNGQSPQSKVNPLFILLCREHGLPAPTPEYLFHQERKWRADYFFPPKVILEVEGGIWTQGRHTRGGGFMADLEKYNEIALMGFILVRCVPADLSSGAACALVKRALERSGPDRIVTSEERP